jgi:hypothetical protein
VSGYLGIILIVAALVAIGVAISSLFSNQIAVFFATLGIFLILWLISSPSQAMGEASGGLLRFLDFSEHFYNTSIEGNRFERYCLLSECHRPGPLSWVRFGGDPEVALMKEQWRRFAPLGLYLSLLAALAAVVIYILQRQWNLYLQISLGLAVIGLALFAALDPGKGSSGPHRTPGAIWEQCSDHGAGFPWHPGRRQLPGQPKLETLGPDRG